jgi:hypothetical protein
VQQLGSTKYRLEAYASAPLRYTSPQVKVLHCLTVKEQEAQRKGIRQEAGSEATECEKTSPQRK